VISCTSAPHPVIHCEPLQEAMRARIWPKDPGTRSLILIDIAQPRDVEEGADTIDGVRLFTIDALRSISDRTMASRRTEAERARQYIGEEHQEFVRLLNRAASEEILAGLYRWAETIRMRERDRALNRLGSDDPRAAEIVDDLTRVLVKKLLADATFSIRASAECGELVSAEALAKAITVGERICFPRNE
jgi:glutamyl-tRNA reductase